MKNRFPLIALAALPLTLGLVVAQTQTPQAQAPQRVQPAQPGQSAPQTPGTQQNQGVPQAPGTRAPSTQAPQRSGTNYADVFLQKLAAQLGITVERLKAAAIAAGSATIDQGVQAGDFPSDRAAEMKQRLQDNPLSFGRGFGGPGGRGGHSHGPRGDRDGDGGRGFGPGADPQDRQGQDSTGPSSQTELGQGAASDAFYDVR